MFNKKQSICILFGCVLVLPFLIFNCASKKSIWGDPQTGLILQYRIAQDQLLNYSVSANQISKIDMMGQTMETTTDVNLDFTMKGMGTDDQKNLLSQISINTLDISVNSMMGTNKINTAALIGKSFSMSLSPTGKKEFIDIESVPKMDFGEMSGEQSIRSYFIQLFPELSEESVKIGKSWTVQSETNEMNGNLDLLIKLESNNTLEGLETIDGMECARIKTEATGTVSGSGSQGGMNITFTGDLNTTSTWYFAYKEGQYLKETAEQILDAKIDLGEMGVIPLTQKTTTEIKLIP